MTRLALVSDTHDNLPLVRKAARFLREQTPDLALHLGDITTPATVELLADLPIRFLRGNNDLDPRLDATLEALGLPPLVDALREEVAGLHLGATHGHLRRAMRDVWDADLVVHGHTHRRKLERHGRQTFLNPGALHRAPVKTLALVELPSREVTFYEVRPDAVEPLRRP